MVPGRVYVYMSINTQEHHYTPRNEQSLLVGAWRKRRWMVARLGLQLDAETIN